MENISIYIHIPFCKRKCKYCDFTSFKGNREMIDLYMTSLMEEIKLYDDILRKSNIKTIFFGGGTPSAVDGQYIYNTMKYLFDNYKIDKDIEVSLELNPGTIDEEKLKIYKEAKINRISMGAQSFNDDILKSIGRIHKEKDIYKTVELLRKNGFYNINLDLMFSLPNQSLEDMKLSLKKAIELKLPHISNYSLILEEGTILYEEYKKGKYKIIDEDLDREMYESSNKILRDNGYKHYEISNFAKDGYECKHNLVYWNIENYLGLGISAHSNYDHKRFYNTSNISQYIELIAKGEKATVETEDISYYEEIAEYVIMGFRKIEGLNLKEFKNRFNLDFEDYFTSEIKKNLDSDLISFDGDNIKLTDKGLNLSNQVELDFYKKGEA